MKIILEAEVMDKKPAMSTPSMVLPGYVAVRLKVRLGQGGSEHGGPFGVGHGPFEQVFQQDVTLREDEVQSIFDHLMKNLTRNMRETLVSYLEDRSYLEKFDLMPVLKFERMR